eukprot:comp13411_c0_seq1/m.8916 comp13411_c0_seq1/g.8916  ORF comp13411_c0_seq1/g.8916 comp13411_c0_seq1/m.8916 type:complete len:856 (-) comp13411_c0_seq1:45-2612(-)
MDHEEGKHLGPGEGPKKMPSIPAMAAAKHAGKTFKETLTSYLAGNLEVEAPSTNTSATTHFAGQNHLSMPENTRLRTSSSAGNSTTLLSPISPVSPADGSFSNSGSTTFGFDSANHGPKHRRIVSVPDLMANDFLQATGLFWDEILRDDNDSSATKLNSREGTGRESSLSSFSYNKMLELCLLEFQADNRTGKKVPDNGFASKFILLMGLCPPAQPHCVLVKLLNDVYPGPQGYVHSPVEMTVVNNRSYSTLKRASSMIEPVSPSRGWFHHYKDYKQKDYEPYEVSQSKLDPRTLPDTICTLLEHWYSVRTEDWRTWEMKTVWQMFLTRFHGDIQGMPEAVMLFDRMMNCPDWNPKFTEMDMKEFARQLTVIDHRLLRAIRSSEFHNCAWTKHKNSISTKQAPNILQAIIHANNMSVWVVAMILNGKDYRKRARTIERFCRLAKYLREYRNYNSLMAIHSALIGFPVQRLKQTVASIDSKARSMIAKLDALLSPNDNYQPLRREIAEQLQQPCLVVPYLGLLLKDYVYVDNMPTMAKDGKYSLKKFNLMAECLLPLHRLSLFPAPPSDDNLDVLIHVMLQPRFTYEELINISAEIMRDGKEILEQETPVLQKQYTSKLPVVAVPTEEAVDSALAFATGQAVDGSASKRRSQSPLLSPLCSSEDLTHYVPPDVVMEMSANRDACMKLEEHIARFVGTIFEHFDRDGNGYISQEEFEDVLSNFPYIDEFELVDKDSDGRLSRREVEDYFLTFSCAETIFCRLDIDNSGTISVDEFAALKELLPTFSCEFSDIDTDKSGTVTLNELRQFLLRNTKIVPRLSTFVRVDPRDGFVISPSTEERLVAAGSEKITDQKGNKK